MKPQNSQNLQVDSASRKPKSQVCVSSQNAGRLKTQEESMF